MRLGPVMASAAVHSKAVILLFFKSLFLFLPLFVGILYLDLVLCTT